MTGVPNKATMLMLTINFFNSFGFGIDGACHIIHELASNSTSSIEQKVEIDSFSGYRIYPSKGKLFVRGDSKVW